MPGLATTSGAIESAQRILGAIEEERELADAVRSGDPRTRKLSIFDRQNIMRNQVILSTWKEIGRQVLAMHPEVVEEVKVATSDKIPVEVLRTLPYMNPLVIFADPPEFDSWLEKNQTHSVTGFHEAKMRLLGFLCYGTTEALSEREEAVPHTGWQYIMATNDPDATRFGMMLVFETLDEDGIVQDIEFNSMSLYFADHKTLGELVDGLTERFYFDSNRNTSVNARKWLRSVMATVVGSLFYLCSTTLEAERVPPKAARNLGRNITRKPLSLYRIGWTTGAALTRYRASRIGYGSEQGDITHQQDPQHRRSHFKLQPCGQGRLDRKLIFVSAYWTHKERLGDSGVNAVHKVPRVNGKGSARESTQTALRVK
jgi:hypothetical protein